MIDPVVVEPVVNREKLLELLALQTEYPALDFKSICDLRKECSDRTRNLVELAKDVGAMSVRGGFIVVGVDGHGNPTGETISAHTAAFDEARLKPALVKWLPDTLQIRTQSHEVGGHHVIVIAVAPNPAGCALFRADGQYPQGKETKTVFREGDVYCRMGTESHRLTQQGLEEIIDQRVQGARGIWQDEHAAELDRLTRELAAAYAGQAITRAPAAAFNLNLGVDVLVAAAIELLRAHDDIPLRLLFQDAVVQARSLLAAGEQAEVSEVVDRVTALAAIFLTLERPEWFGQAVATLTAIYDLPLEHLGVGQPYVDQPTAAFWLMVCERVLGLGSLAVRLGNWPAVRRLAEHRVPVGGSSYRSWIHHTVVLASRGGQMTVSLLSRAREVVRAHGFLHPDVPAHDERIMNGLAQFDFLACLVASSLRAGWSPNFAAFYTARTQPIAERLVQDSELRHPVFPGDDRRLAVALREIDTKAQQAGFNYDGWEGYSQPVESFITAHPSVAG